MTSSLTLDRDPSFIWTNWTFWLPRHKPEWDQNRAAPLSFHYSWTQPAWFPPDKLQMYLNGSDLFLTKPLERWDQNIVGVLDLRVRERSASVSSGWCNTKKSSAKKWHQCSGRWKVSVEVQIYFNMLRRSLTFSSPKQNYLMEKLYKISLCLTFQLKWLSTIVLAQSLGYRPFSLIRMISCGSHLTSTVVGSKRCSVVLPVSYINIYTLIHELFF